MLPASRSWKTQLLAMQDARDKLINYENNKIIRFTYAESKLIVGFDFDVMGGTSFDLDFLEPFLRQLDLPSDVRFSADGMVDLTGKLGVDFALGVDLSEVTELISFDELFFELDDLTLEGFIDASQIAFDLGYGPLDARVDQGTIDLDLGVDLGFANGATVLTLNQLLEEGADAIESKSTIATLKGDLDVSVAVDGVTAAETELRFETDDLFGTIDDIISQLPTLDDIAKLNIQDIIDGLLLAVDFIDREALSNQSTVAQIPLLNEYLETAVADVRTAPAGSAKHRQPLRKQLGEDRRRAE